MDIQKALTKAQSQLKRKVVNPLQETECLLGSVLKTTPLEVYLRKKLSQQQTQQFFFKIKSKIKGIPLRLSDKGKVFL